jgi:predicted tellurium resistance membrane protein TerC
LNAELWIALFTLSALEIVLGVDNLVFISIAVGRLPAERRAVARKLGLAFACLTRIALLITLAWFARMDDKHMPLFTLFGQIISVRDLILGGGGVFLIVKGIMEIAAALRGKRSEIVAGAATASLALIVAQIAIIDIVFSLDSVITAVGMVRDIPVMVGAIVLAVAVMMFAATPVGNFIDAHPTIRMLALAFIVLIGGVLVAECFEIHVPRVYIYGAMAFAAIVETLNLCAAKNRERNRDS